MELSRPDLEAAAATAAVAAAEARAAEAEARAAAAAADVAGLSLESLRDMDAELVPLAPSQGGWDLSPPLTLSQIATTSSSSTSTLQLPAFGSLPLSQAAERPKDAAAELLRRTWALEPLLRAPPPGIFPPEHVFGELGSGRGFSTGGTVSFTDDAVAPPPAVSATSVLSSVVRTVANGGVGLGDGTMLVSPHGNNEDGGWVAGVTALFASQPKLPREGKEELNNTAEPHKQSPTALPPKLRLQKKQPQQKMQQASQDQHGKLAPPNPAPADINNAVGIDESGGSGDGGLTGIRVHLAFILPSLLVIAALSLLLRWIRRRPGSSSSSSSSSSGAARKKRERYVSRRSSAVVARFKGQWQRPILYSS